MTYTFWILLTASLVGISCGIVGVLLILRKMAMLSDAISHTVLLGIISSYLITNSLDGFYMFIGAAIVGVLTTVFVQLLNSAGVQSDAAIGVVFTFLFAIGVILVSMFARDVHIDVEHSIMGEIAFIPWMTVDWFGIEGIPQAVWMLGFVLIIDLFLILLLYKEFKLSSFDPGLAAALGLPVGLLHYVLMGMTSITAVASFDAVGAILVVAMLIAPGATAYLLTERLHMMFILSAVFGVIAAVTGYFIAAWLNASIAGMMATMAGVLFLLAFIFSPTHGIIAKRFSQRKIQQVDIET
ncbi:manganese/zinc/iron transport system permease protein [Geomicrobium halophilum]|uniref:Manganese/zinc/iron transport system permease protein n=1 Tax=Geomicrobium halophilum TaxID=549000 RepID=A0A841PWM0_9BACL|nr:metal ABC transporter permease [Geomicrobium halophilum]MBB6448392.1 manganese/zinc/iron transport system permease protein [Geomicrobium halophilum]